MQVQGLERDGIRIFLGIPYAEPPVGPLRFAPPRPAQPWEGVRDATRFARQAPQLDVIRHRPVGDEDCLYLNVYAPQGPGPFPVMVWIHGGGGVTGSPNEYDGTAFAQHGVVVVAVAYRLGVLGWLGGNFALMDQVLALRWVREHVAEFGGDPDRVTLAGESNGGRTVGTLLATPEADGLFQQAIVQSGTGVGYAVHTPEQAAEVEAAVLAELDNARDAPVARILEAQAKVAAASRIAVPFQVVMYGTPIEAIAAGAARGVRLLVGTNHDEQDLFAAIDTGFNGSESMVVSREVFEQAVTAYRRLLPHWSEQEVRNHAMTSSEWWIPAIRLAEAQHRAGGEVWMYRLDWRLAPRGAGWGAPHALDLLFMFDGWGVGNLRKLFRLSADDGHEMAELMHGAWVDFVADGDPGWPAYEPSNRTTFLFDRDARAENDPDQALRLVWGAIR